LRSKSSSDNPCHCEFRTSASRLANCPEITTVDKDLQL
jgi:hypothetical protein